MAKPTRYTAEMIDEYVSRGYWDRVTLVDIFEQNAKEYAKEEAVVDSTSRLTWSQLKQLSDRLAFGFLELGIKKDDVIVAQLPNWVEHVALGIAFQKAGILGSFVPMTWRQAEIRQLFELLTPVGVVIPLQFRNFDYFQMSQDIRASLSSLRHVFIVGDDVPEGAISIRGMGEQPLEVKYPSDYLQNSKFGPFEVSVIGHTSGTTGLPKLCEWTSCAMRLAGKGVVQRLKLTPDDVMGIFTPLNGGPGYMGLLGALETGAKLALLERLEAEEALKLMEKERITAISTVTPVLVRILSYSDIDKYDISSLRVVRTGAVALPASIAAEAEERLKCPIVPTAGSMDTITFTHASIDDAREVRYGTVGKPTIGNEIKIVDDVGKEVPRGVVGEMWVRGACTGSGYYKNIDATKEAWGELGKEGWFRSGDLAKFDEQGNVIIVGRKKDVIIRGGQNIYPAEIEAILSGHSKVSYVAVVGMPDPVMVEKACAYVVPEPGQQLSFDGMVSFLREQKMAPYKLPERLEIMERLPMLVDGAKVDKRALVEDITQKLKAEGKI